MTAVSRSGLGFTNTYGAYLGDDLKIQVEADGYKASDWACFDFRDAQQTEVGKALCVRRIALHRDP